MSVYSGFTTRQQETFYLKLIEKFITILSNKLIKILLLAEPDNKFNQYIRKIFKCVQQMDRNKHLEPHFSETMEPLYRFIKKNYTFSAD